MFSYSTQVIPDVFPHETPAFKVATMLQDFQFENFLSFGEKSKSETPYTPCSCCTDYCTN